MKIEIKNRWTGSIIVTMEADSFSTAVRMAIKQKVILQHADLRSANLRSANLTRANLTRANLTDANLTRADLTDANLTRANLTRADLTRANLTDANLTRADLTRANLRSANLTDANLTRADLTRADLRSADLTRADLRSADLTDANLTAIRDDLWSVLSAAPEEAAGVVEALEAGRVDGSVYHGDCACLIGTIANIRGCTPETLGLLRPNSARPIERFFMGIRNGDTPDTNSVSNQALEWTVKWIEAMKQAFGQSVETKG